MSFQVGTTSLPAYTVSVCRPHDIFLFLSFRSFDNKLRLASRMFFTVCMVMSDGVDVRC